VELGTLSVYTTIMRAAISSRNSVRHMHAMWRQCTADSLIPHERAISLVFWHERWLVGDAPSLWNLRSKWPTPSKNANINRFPLI